MTTYSRGIPAFVSEALKGRLILPGTPRLMVVFIFRGSLFLYWKLKNFLGSFHLSGDGVKQPLPLLPNHIYYFDFSFVTSTVPLENE